MDKKSSNQKANKADDYWLKKGNEFFQSKVNDQKQKDVPLKSLPEKYKKEIKEDVKHSKTRSSLMSIFFIVLVIGVASYLFSDKTASIHGIITDTRLSTLSSVKILIDGDFNQINNDDGTYHISYIPKGLHTVTFEKDGYEPYIQIIDLKPQENLEIEIKLKKMIQPTD